MSVDFRPGTRGGADRGLHEVSGVRRARRYAVERRRKAWIPVPVVSPTDFHCRYQGDLDFRRLWRRAVPELTPYCLDPHERCVIFARTPAQADLDALGPFFYEVQREHAKELIRVPYEQVIEVAERESSLATGLVFLHSTGRCGSTLLCRMLGAVPQVQSVSEPDFYSQAVVMQARGEDMDVVELNHVLRACTLLLAAHLRHRRPDRHTVVIKLRGMCTYIADRLAAALPEARHLFLYRNAVDTTNSFVSAIIGPRIGGAMAFGSGWLPIGMCASAPGLGWRIRAIAPLAMQRDYGGARARGLVGLFALSWLSKMDRAAAMQRRNPGLFAARVRYEDLKRQGLAMAPPLLQGLDLGGLDSAAESMLEAVLAQESQQGSRLASHGRRVLGARDEALIRRLLRQHPSINAPDYRLAGTLGPDSEAPAAASRRAGLVGVGPEPTGEEAW